MSTTGDHHGRIDQIKAVASMSKAARPTPTDSRARDGNRHLLRVAARRQSVEAASQR
jgi:hypothetical protein